MLRVLIIEDSPVNMRLAVTILSRGGYETLQADSAAPGIEIARKVHPDLILMDLGLPEVDGIEATRILKADPKTSDIPIIAVTAYAMKGDKERALQAGCDGYITKPIEPLEFLEEIGSIARRLAGPSQL